MVYRHRVLLTLCLLAFLSFGGLASLNRTGAAAAVGAAPATPGTRDFGAWRYSVTAEGPDSAEVAIAYDKRSADGLRAYAQANNALGRQLQASGTPINGTVITFKRPLSLDEFTAFVANHKLQVSDYTMRMTAPGGHRWTIGGAPVNGELVPRGFLDREINFVRGRAPDAMFNGVVDATLSFDGAGYAQLQAHPDVFLIDVTKTVILQELKQRKPQLDERKFIVDASRPYWFLENQGLLNSR